MATFTKGYVSVASQPVGAGAENLIGTNTGNCDIGGSFDVIELDPGFGNSDFPTGATFTSIQVALTAQTLTSATSTLRVTPRLGSISNDSDDLDINAPGSYLTDINKGLFGLSPTVNSIQFLTIRFTLITPNSTTTRITKSVENITASGGTPNITISYTLPFSNKVYNTGGKLSITSGKVSIT